MEQVRGRRVEGKGEVFAFWSHCLLGCLLLSFFVFVVAAAAVVLAQLLCRLSLGYSWLRRKKTYWVKYSVLLLGEVPGF